MIQPEPASGKGQVGRHRPPAKRVSGLVAGILVAGVLSIGVGVTALVLRRPAARRSASSLRQGTSGHRRKPVKRHGFSHGFIPELERARQSSLAARRRNKEPPPREGWHLRSAGSTPWGDLDEGRNSTSYYCLFAVHEFEVQDTLLSGYFDCSSTTSCSLRFRHHLRMGRRSYGTLDMFDTLTGKFVKVPVRFDEEGNYYDPTRGRYDPYDRGTHLTPPPGFRVVGTADDWRTWQLVHEFYGTHEGLEGYQAFDITRWAAGCSSVQFAWIAHTYDRENLVHWCVDDIAVTGPGEVLFDLQVAELRFPREEFAAVPEQNMGYTFLMRNRGSRRMSARMKGYVYGEDDREFSDAVDMEVDVPGQGRRLCRSRARRWEGAHYDSDSGYPSFNAVLKVYLTRLFDQRAANDTLEVRFRLAEDTWQSVNIPRPIARLLEGRSLAAAATEDADLYVFAVDTPWVTSSEPVFARYSLREDRWMQLKSPPRLPSVGTDLGRLILTGLAASDSQVCLLSFERGPVLVYSLAADSWRVVLPPRFGSDSAGQDRFAGMLENWGGARKGDGALLYAPSEQADYFLSLSADTWLMRPRGFPLQSGFWNSALPSLGVAYSLQDGGRLVGYDVRGAYWYELDTMPAVGKYSVRACAADDDRHSVYYLLAFNDEPQRLSLVEYVVLNASGRSGVWRLQLARPEWEWSGGSVSMTRGGRYLFVLGGSASELRVYNMKRGPLHGFPRM